MPLPVPASPCLYCSNNSRRGGSERKRLHAFDDVLLIVFFSHARYDVNLDYYRGVYGEWFPNILFIGPKSREDKGFKHSYDVLVDSYASDENLTDPKNYKMAGRMAHHMLYTALTRHPCYKGYLWAPFDALLNVPRLTLFDQERFWYHSFAGEYVYNPNLKKPAPKLNSRHATPVVVGPDPKVDWTVGWRGWGPDWWYVIPDPNVGLKVCYPAFLRAPEHMRSRMSSFFTNGTTRLIGGSADTLYIPGKYREVFADTLGLFLETECFLEIAVPTTVHLERMKGKGIQFVDHWWIWYPPFNATFVRQKWAEGYEVDTMHTFHWGDVDVDGEWRGRPQHIYDLRMLMKESAERQGIAWP
ncbi:hypothetical protein NEOLEDRAFT_1077746 [Neolentinus lepideus HHB14362 ss-1]|uniref:Glycosyltransferase family 15 protein n=1 Tax=Neolentinus lepideus HHB14362 ss-1 TaxID=1314782 RepID=A0A165NCK7_9AGAM|nr:hypothetical protein NEOLEDRAFT_1077746 [Neolentinus lepideus HHB14362 ss-1]